LARRAALIDAAIEVVAEQGIAGVTHRSVAARAGFPPSTTSYFFPSIDDLLIEAMQERMSRQIEIFKATAETIGGTRLEPSEMMEALIAVIVEIPDAHVMAQFDLYLTAARRRDVRAGAIEMIDSFTELAALMIEQAGFDNHVGRAQVLVATLDGLAFQRLARGTGPQEYERQLREALTLMFRSGDQVSPATRPKLKVAKG
jgi:DNA-binding transcriptional regulator YbjK